MRDDLSALFIPDGERDPLRAARRDLKRPLPKKFYAEASVAPVEEGFGVVLDGKPVHTPARKKLAVPARGLAEALAAEWQGQGDEIDPATMPKTRLINTALDGVARDKEAVAAEIAKYAGSDLVCYRAGGPQRLVEAQDAAWNPVLEFIRERLGVRFICAEGVMFADQPEESAAAVQEAVTAFGEGGAGAIKLAALHVMTTLTGSALIALALAQGDLSFDAAWDAAHVDEDYQMRLWGADEEALARRAARKADMRAAYEVFSALEGEA